MGYWVSIEMGQWLTCVCSAMDGPVQIWFTTKQQDGHIWTNKIRC